MAKKSDDAEPSKEIVTLVSSDGFEFVLSREAAMVSGTLRGMLSAEFAEAKSGRVELENLTAIVLEMICEYLLYNWKYRDQLDVPDFDIPPEMALELLVAADFLDGKFARNEWQVKSGPSAY